MNKHNKEGFSLLELLLVLGIVSALIISAFIIYPKVQTMYRVDKISKIILGAKSSIQELYQGKAYYDTEFSKLRKIAFPADTYTKSNGVPRNDYGGMYNITGQFSISSGGYGYSGFSINVTSVPSADCQKIISNVYTSFQAVYAGNTLVYQASKNFGNRQIGFDRSVIAEACNKAERVTIQFYTL
ncbi:TPA: prepilin-type N-terminal cleavage/methylation domain-containing protein [Escherichia coli]|nr:prepilin-type N-terminal cleavage/methylation domain-containing protein [Escherichia coli]